MLDGEIVIPIDGTLSFEELQLRLHPAASRVRRLAAAHPARMMLFDLLVDEAGHDLTGHPLSARRAALEALMPRLASPALALSPASRKPRRGAVLARRPRHAGATGWWRSGSIVPTAPGSGTGW